MTIGQVAMPTAEMLPFADSDGGGSGEDSVYQSFAAWLLPATASVAGRVVTELELDGSSSPSVGDMESSALEQLMQNEWFQRNISRSLNISMANLTQLITSVQNTSTHYQLPQRDPVPLLTTLTVFYTLIFIAGVLGNMITCIVISRNKFMHTATNFYLFNLAVSDLILLLSGMPQDLYNIWYPQSYPFTDVLCVLESVLSETAANATVLTITAFTVERYIAICHPFRQHTMSKLSRAIKFIFAIWVTAFTLALPQAMQFSVVSQNGGTSCTMNNDFYAHVFAVSGFIFFGGPMTAICVLYVLIGVKLKRSRMLQAVPRRCYDVQRGISAQSRVIRMLVAVAVAFFLCWAPFHAQRLMAVYGSTSKIDSELFNEIFRILDYTSGVLYFLSTCINPLLYNIMSHKFREAFKVTLARHFGLATKYQTQTHNYSALLRQNGSMRQHTTDSIRTTTTTTTINSASGGSYGPMAGAASCGGGGAGVGSGGSGGSGIKGVGIAGGSNSRSSSLHRNRCISVGSQSALMTSLGKNDSYASNLGRGSIAESYSHPHTHSHTHTHTHPNPQPLTHRMLQSQISQLSSVGDANSLLEMDVGSTAGPQYHPHPHPHPHTNTSHRLKELRRATAGSQCKGASSEVATATASSSSVGAAAADDCISIDSQQWEENAPHQRCTDGEIELVTKPVAPPLVASGAHSSVQQMSSVAELANGAQPTRSRLKLSRIITRRDQDAASQKARKPMMSKTLDSLTEKFRWRTRRKSPVQRDQPSDSCSHLRQESSSSTSSVGTPTPTTALMKIVYPTAEASATPGLNAGRTVVRGYATTQAL